MRARWAEARRTDVPQRQADPYPDRVAHDDGAVSYRFALRPLWILSHLFVLACIVGMFRAGFWQLDRLHQRQELNATVAARATEPPLTLDGAAALVDTEGVDGADFRTVEATGRYLSDEQVLVRNRSQNGSPGYWVLTPLADDASDHVVTVNRGWVPIELVERPDGAELYAAPDGPVTVAGYVRATEEREGLGVEDPPGDLDTLSRVDVERYDQQVDAELDSYWIQLSLQAPEQAQRVPEAVPLPPPDDGPHLNYAGQWFIFGTLTAIVYPLLLRRRAHKPAERHGVPEQVRDETVGAAP